MLAFILRVFVCDIGGAVSRGRTMLQRLHAPTMHPRWQAAIQACVDVLMACCQCWHRAYSHVCLISCVVQAYKPLCTSSERNMSVMWGKLAADTLTGNYEQVGLAAHTRSATSAGTVSWEW
jgi:hypothetical protein